jgi:hypothetical protein
MLPRSTYVYTTPPVLLLLKQRQVCWVYLSEKILSLATEPPSEETEKLSKKQQKKQRMKAAEEARKGASVLVLQFLDIECI